MQTIISHISDITILQGKYVPARIATHMYAMRIPIFRLYDLNNMPLIKILKID